MLLFFVQSVTYSRPAALNQTKALSFEKKKKSNNAPTPHSWTFLFHRFIVRTELLCHSQLPRNAERARSLLCQVLQSVRHLLPIFRPGAKRVSRAGRSAALQLRGNPLLASAAVSVSDLHPWTVRSLPGLQVTTDSDQRAATDAVESVQHTMEKHPR